MAKNMCLKMGMKKTLSGNDAVRKRTARERLFSLVGYDLVARRRTAQKGTKLEEKLRIQKDEPRVKLKGDSEGDVLCLRRMKALGQIAYSGWSVNDGLEEFEKKNSYFKNPMAVQVVEKFMGNRVDGE